MEKKKKRKIERGRNRYTRRYGKTDEREERGREGVREGECGVGVRNGGEGGEEQWGRAKGAVSSKGKRERDQQRGC